MHSRYDIAIIGAGHNGLVAACYLALAGKKVVILESQGNIGGASISAEIFDGFDVRVSRYAYLLSLFPDKIIKDLGLNISCHSRTIASYTPYVNNGKHMGLRISGNWDTATELSFQQLTGSSREAESWKTFYSRLQSMAAKIAPTLLEPLPSRHSMKKLLSDDQTWQDVFERPLGETLMEWFESDLVRGIILTDGLIGTHSSAFDIQANCCFLYHVMGNGTGEWKVPVGGMGALIHELRQLAIKKGVDIFTNTAVTGVHRSAHGIELDTSTGLQFKCNTLFCNASPKVLGNLLGRSDIKTNRQGCQTKINLLLRKLPAFKSGVDPSVALTGTLHIHEGFEEMERAYEQSCRSMLPAELPFEMYCHTLTDPTIMSRSLQDAGYHTMTIFVLHTPADLFKKDNTAMTKLIREKVFASLNEFLAEPIEDCIACSANGSLCMEIKTPLDLEASLGMPDGNIFHGDLQFPFLKGAEDGIWGVETEDPHIYICGAGARRGGGVSGIPGHNAAMALLSKK